MKKGQTFIGFSLLVLFLTGCYYNVELDLYGPRVDCAETVAEYAGYAAHIDPMISTACADCHSGANPEGGLLLETHAQQAAAADLILELIQLPASSPDLMPPGAPLHPCDQELFETWIQNGKLND
jgi:hypothetical protein